MPIFPSNESYNGQPYLKANVGKWVTASFDFSMRFSKGSGVSNTVTYTELGNLSFLTFQSGNWGDEGIIDGDNIILEFTVYQGPPQGIPVTLTAQVDYVDQTVLYLVNPLPINSGVVFPTTNLVSGVLVVADKNPSEIEFQFNLAPNGSNSLGSVIDGELSRFSNNLLGSVSAGTTLPMTQLINKSGSLIKDVQITYIGEAGSDYLREFRIDYKFIQWGFIQDGFSEPQYFDSADHIAPLLKIKAFSIAGNPNGMIEKNTTNVEANTGGYDESFNGGVNNYSPISIQFFDALGDPIDAIDYSGLCTFEAVINAPNQVNPASIYNIGLIWRPIDGSFYQNKANTNLGENLLLIAPEVDFNPDGSIDPTLYQGLENEDGARWDFTNIQFELTGVDELTFRGTIIPNQEAADLFSAVPDGGRRSTLWVELGNVSLPAQASDRVALKLFDEDNYDAPTLGVQISTVEDEFLLDHAGQDITLPNPQTTTEDDVLYRSRFKLLEAIEYDGIRAKISAFNTTTEEEFTLEEIFFSFNSVPFIANKYEVNETFNRGFNLPPNSDRNAVRLFRDPTLDGLGFYGIVIEYGWLNRWEYWLEQANVDPDFFDTNEQFNGFNKNWQRFSGSGDWIVRVSYFIRKDGVDDFNHQEVGIRPYEDDPNVSTSWGIEVLSTGQNPTNLVANELHEITAILTWATGAYTNPWAEMTIENFEAGNRWVISSVLAHGGISQNPLQPISGASQLDLTFPSVNIAVLKAYVDTNLIDADKVSLSARIYSDDEPIPPEKEFLINNEKDALGAYSVARKLSPDSIYSGPLIRVRRGLDNAELDIPYIDTGSECILDEAALLAFTGNQIDDYGWVVTRYDQTENNNHATQTVLSDQAPIVIDGVVQVDPATLRPAMKCDGVNHHGQILVNLGLTNDREILSLSVFHRLGSNDNCIGFANNINSNPHSMYWVGVFNTIQSGFGSNSPNDVHFSGQNQIGSQINIAWRNSSNDIRMRLNGVLGVIRNDDSIPQKYDTLEKLGGTYHEGYKSEDVLYGRTRIETELWIENNVNTFYAIF